MYLQTVCMTKSKVDLGGWGEHADNLRYFGFKTTKLSKTKKYKIGFIIQLHNFIAFV